MKRTIKRKFYFSMFKSQVRARKLPIFWFVIFMLSFFTFLILTSCPNPLSPELVNQINDTTGPVITITEPADRSEYSTVVRVSGTVDDSIEEYDFSSRSQVSRCSYAVTGTTIGGNFEVDDEGSFSFTFVTKENEGTWLVSGPATLELTACDWSGHKSIESIQLIPSETGAAPGFFVTPGYREATIEWDDVPGAESYELFEYKYGQTRSDVRCE